MQVPEGIPHVVKTKEEIRRAFVPALQCFCENWSATEALESAPRLEAIVNHKTKKVKVKVITHDEWGEIEEPGGPIVACMHRKLARVTFDLGNEDTTIRFPLNHFSCWRQPD